MYQMNSQSLLSSKKAAAQARSLASRSDTNGNGKPVIHLRRSNRHSAKCGLDLRYHLVVVTSKVAETNCKNCLRAHQASVALRRKASAWERDHQRQKSNDLDSYVHTSRAAHIASAVEKVTYPAELKPNGFVALEAAFQRAVEDVELAQLQKLHA